MKNVIKRQIDTKRADVLPLVLLGFRSSVNTDSGYVPAELVCGTTLRLPCYEKTCWVETFCDNMQKMQARKVSRQGNTPSHVIP